MAGTPTPTPVDDRSHTLHRFTGRLVEDVQKITDPFAWSLGNTELTEATTELVTAMTQLQACLLTLIAEADQRDLATAVGSVNTTAWFRSLSRHTASSSLRLVKQALALDAHPVTAQALAHGDLLPEQAHKIVSAVEALPDHLDVHDYDRAERHLLAEAAHHDAKALRALGRHLLEVIDPDAADEVLAARLVAEEAAAAKATHFTGYHDRRGSFHFNGQMPSRHGAQLESLLQALLNPSRPDPIARQDAEGTHRATPELRGEALTQLIERYPVDRLPNTGGLNAAVVITIPLETLEGRLGSAGILGTDLQLSPAEARRLACAAGVIPAVLDGDSQVLDWGRKRRLHSQHQRLALAIKQGGTCGVEACDRPSSWADAHHVVSWSAGGLTSMENGVLLCARHHTLAHSNHLQLIRQSPGTYRLQRRQ